MRTIAFAIAVGTSAALVEATVLPWIPYARAVHLVSVIATVSLMVAPTRVRMVVPLILSGAVAEALVRGGFLITHVAAAYIAIVLLRPTLRFMGAPPGFRATVAVGTLFATTLVLIPMLASTPLSAWRMTGIHWAATVAGNIVLTRIVLRMIRRMRA